MVFQRYWKSRCDEDRTRSTYVRIHLLPFIHPPCRLVPPLTPSLFLPFVYSLIYLQLPFFFRSTAPTSFDIETVHVTKNKERRRTGNGWKGNHNHHNIPQYKPTALINIHSCCFWHPPFFSFSFSVDWNWTYVWVNAAAKATVPSHSWQDITQWPVENNLQSFFFVFLLSRFTASWAAYEFSHASQKGNKEKTHTETSREEGRKRAERREGEGGGKRRKYCFLTYAWY